MSSHVQRLLLLWQPPEVVSHCALWHVNIALHHPWVHPLPQVHHLQIIAADPTGDGFAIGSMRQSLHRTGIVEVGRAYVLCCRWPCKSMAAHNACCFDCVVHNMKLRQACPGQKCLETVNSFWYYAYQTMFQHVMRIMIVIWPTMSLCHCQLAPDATQSNKATRYCCTSCTLLMCVTTLGKTRLGHKPTNLFVIWLC